MSSATYDTRFFVEHYYSDNAGVTASTTREIRKQKEKSVSAIVLHELYNLTLQREARQVAVLRAELLRKDFGVVPVDGELAIASAELRKKYGTPMADSIIAATAIMLRTVCVTDDPHITKIREVRTRWI